MNTLISLSDIKYDLLKIIEPYDNVLGKTEWRPVIKLFTQYLSDLKRSGAVREFNTTYSIKDGTIVYDIGIKITSEKSPKKIKIYVSTFSAPWVEKKR